MSHRSCFQLTVSFLCVATIAACSSGGGTSSDGAAGTGGATAGTGGSPAGSGGATGGTGGSTAGAGGSTAGAGGIDAGAGGSVSDGAAGTDGAISDGATTDVSVDAGTCPVVANVATAISDVSVGGATPVGTGGAISDGTYTMTAHPNYANASTTLKMHTYTFKFTGNVVALTGHDNTDADKSIGFTLTANTTTGAMSLIGFCPPDYIGLNLGGLDSYTATATVITAYSSASHNGVVLTKQ